MIPPLHPPLCISMKQTILRSRKRRRTRTVDRPAIGRIRGEHLEQRILLAADLNSPPSPPPPGATFVEHAVIGDTVDGPRGVASGDIDGDGDKDIVVASYRDDSIRWFDNQGGGVFTEKTISTLANGAQSGRSRISMATATPTC
ncbi:MAG: LEPR-XLL domain-containing protein [Phycisphaera sp. RhM]|nr:LEPR-XLL domain-containing protein [Phycisphaera sp. RhM]